MGEHFPFVEAEHVLKIPSCFGQTEGIKIPPIHNSDIATSDQGSSPLPRICRSITQFCVPGCKQLPALGSNSDRNFFAPVSSPLPRVCRSVTQFCDPGCKQLPRNFFPSVKGIDKQIFHFGRCGNEVCWHCNQGYMWVKPMCR